METKEDFKKKILEMAKARGLDLAEDAAEKVVDLAMDVVSEVVALTENKYDDMIWTAVKGKVEEALDNLADKIDGEEG